MGEHRGTPSTRQGQPLKARVEQDETEETEEQRTKTGVHGPPKCKDMEAAARTGAAAAGVMKQQKRQLEERVAVAGR